MEIRRLEEERTWRVGNVSKLDVPPVLWDVCQAVGSLCGVQEDEVVSHSQYVTGLVLNLGLFAEPGLLPHTVCSSEMRSPLENSSGVGFGAGVVK